jgi:hypothetical protein
MPIEVDKISLDKTIKNLRRYSKEAEQKTNDAIMFTATQIETDAKLNTPVLTNRLRSSEHIQKKETTAYNYKDNEGKSYDGLMNVNLKKGEVAVGTNVNYAIFQERKHKFLFKAYNKNRKLLEKELKRLLKKFRK